jgi:hypothetical protein
MNEDPRAHSDASAPETAILVEQTDYDRHEPKSGLIALVSGSILVMLAVMIVGIYALYMNAYETVDYDQYSGVASKELQAIHEREEDQLHRYSFIDKEKGIVRVPIDRAMEIVAAEYGEGKVGYNTKSYPVKVELLGGAAGGTNAPAPTQPAATTPAATTPAPSQPVH